jgi:quercetin dioxygenase-like cupin family protein
MAGGMGESASSALTDWFFAGDCILPPGAGSGKHTQSGNEIAYIHEGSVTFEAQGKPAVTLKPGEAFTTVDGEVHNVKNASSSAPAKALAFYVAKKGTGLEDLSVPAK